MEGFLVTYPKNHQRLSLSFPSEVQIRWLHTNLTWCGALLASQRAQQFTKRWAKLRLCSITSRSTMKKKGLFFSQNRSWKRTGSISLRLVINWTTANKYKSNICDALKWGDNVSVLWSINSFIVIKDPVVTFGHSLPPLPRQPAKVKLRTLHPRFVSPLSEPRSHHRLRSRARSCCLRTQSDLLSCAHEYEQETAGSQ